MILVLPSGGPTGSILVAVRCQFDENQSDTHSQTFPVMFQRLKSFAGKALTGARPLNPSSPLSRYGNSPCQMLQRCRPPGVRSSPHGYCFPLSPARQAIPIPTP